MIGHTVDLMHDQWNVKIVNSLVLSQISVAAYTLVQLYSTVCSSGNSLCAQKTQRVNCHSVAIALSCIRRHKRRKTLFLRRLTMAGYLASIPTLDRGLVCRLTRTSPFHSTWLPVGISPHVLSTDYCRRRCWKRRLSTRTKSDQNRSVHRQLIATNENKHGIIDILHTWLLFRVSTDA